MTYTQWDLYGAILGASIGGGVVAVLAQRFFEWLTAPEIKIHFEPESACTDTPYVGAVTHSARYLRVRVENKGKSPAKECRIYVSAITKSEDSGVSTKIIDNDLIDLSWSYGLIEDNSAISTIIPSGVSRHGDIAYVVDLGTRRDLAMASKSFPRRIERYFESPGIFHVKVIVAGANFQTKTEIVAFSFGDQFSDFQAISPKARFI